jgi:hypothetical protein
MSKSKKRTKSVSKKRQGKAKAKKSKIAKARFASATHLFAHLKGRQIVSGVLHPTPGDNYSVMFTANGRDWLALPVQRIEDARLLGHTTVDDTTLPHARVTLSGLSNEQAAAFSTLSQLYLKVDAKLPSSPPPVCPNGIARWFGDHWECT